MTCRIYLLREERENVSNLVNSISKFQEVEMENRNEGYLADRKTSLRHGTAGLHLFPTV